MRKFEPITPLFKDFIKILHFSKNLVRPFFFPSCGLSEMVDKVHELGNLLRRLPVKEENVVLDKDIIEWRDFRDIILHDIDCFQGLDGYGYFCINKSLLTSIVANFMTYFIILIDFKIN